MIKKKKKKKGYCGTCSFGEVFLVICSIDLDPNRAPSAGFSEGQLKQHLHQLQKFYTLFYAISSLENQSE